MTMGPGAGLWSCAASSLLFPKEEKYVFLQKKKDIGWNKEQNIKSQAYVLKGLNPEPEFWVFWCICAKFC